jgi:hypothetical protein
VIRFAAAGLLAGALPFVMVGVLAGSASACTMIAGWPDGCGDLAVAPMPIEGPRAEDPAPNAVLTWDGQTLTLENGAAWPGGTGAGSGASQAGDGSAAVAGQ